MATQLSLVCPICNGELALTESLRDHLIQQHSKRQLSELVVAEEEEKQMGLDS